MPRKSAASLEITRPRSRSTGLRPPPTLSEPERNLFVAIIRNCGVDHFRESDLPLLTRYCESSILAERAAAELREAPVLDGKPSPWLYVREKSVRDMVALSMRLRLSPQARKGGHAMSVPKPLSYSDQVRMGYADDDKPWWQDDEPDDDDERQVRRQRSMDFRSAAQKAEAEKFPGTPDDE